MISCDKQNTLSESSMGSMPKSEETVENIFRFMDYAFYVDGNGKNVVLKYGEDLETVIASERYNIVNPSLNDFESLEKGMDVFEVVRRVGIPKGTASFGMITLVFDASDGTEFIIYWNPDMTLASVKKC